MPDDSRPVERTTLPQNAAERLRQMILDGELAPGERLLRAAEAKTTAAMH